MADLIIKYLGNADLGEHYYGIPARDLSASEYNAMSVEQRALVRSDVLYDYSDFRDALKKQSARADAKEAKAAAVVADAAVAVPAEDVTPVEYVPAVDVIENVPQ